MLADQLLSFYEPVYKSFFLNQAEREMEEKEKAEREAEKAKREAEEKAKARDLRTRCLHPRIEYDVHVEIGSRRAIASLSFEPEGCPGLAYPVGAWGRNYESLTADLCTNCGTIVRFHVENTDRPWSTGRPNPCQRGNSHNLID